VTGPTGAGAFTGPTGPQGSQGAAGGAAAAVTGNIGDYTSGGGHPTGYAEFQVIQSSNLTGPTGLWFQFGTVPNNNTGTVVLTFPTPFPNNCWFVSLNLGNSNPNYWATSSKSKTGVTFNINSAQNSGTDGYQWFAIGN
jgi:hypothetical protein